MPARVMGTRGRDIGVSQGLEHHVEQGSSWVHHGTEVPVWWLRHGSRRRAGLHRALGHGTSSAANAGPPHGADVWLADRDIQGWSLLVHMQTGIDCTGLMWPRVSCGFTFPPARGCLHAHSLIGLRPLAPWWRGAVAGLPRAMQPGSTPRRGFEKGFLIRKSTDKCISEGVPDQAGILEMGFSAAFLIRKGFSVWVPDGVPDHVP